MDGTVRRIETGYEVRGMVASLTSYDDPDLGQGSPLNQVRYRYNAFAQLDREWQAHRGLVDEQTTPCVEYAYAGVADGLRLESLRYPNGCPGPTAFTCTGVKAYMV